MIGGRTKLNHGRVMICKPSLTQGGFFCGLTTLGKSMRIEEHE